MTKPILLFTGGTHGNLLSRCLSIASGTTVKFDLWRENHGAHAKHDFERVIEHLHPCDTDSKDIHTYITYYWSDIYKILLWIYYAGGESNLDLLDDSSLRLRISNHNHIITAGMGDQIAQFDNNDIGTVEFLKNLIRHMHQHLIDERDTVLSTRNVKFIVEYGEFFKKDTMLEMIKRVLKNLDLLYMHDVDEMCNKFLLRMKPFTASEQRVKQAFTAWKQNKACDISNFLLIEKACLCYYIEEDLGYEIENFMKFPKNTQDIETREAWYD